jgi:hypothetical protein
MKQVLLLFAMIVVLPDLLAYDGAPRAEGLPPGCEVAMSPGMRITATTAQGTIAEGQLVV